MNLFALPNLCTLDDVFVIVHHLCFRLFFSSTCLSVMCFLMCALCGAGEPLFPLSIYFLIFSFFYFFLSFIGFTYFLLLSIPSLSTRIVPPRFQAGGRRRRPNLGSVSFFCFLFCVCVICVICIYSLVKMHCWFTFVCSFSA